MQNELFVSTSVECHMTWSWGLLFPTWEVAVMEGNGCCCWRGKVFEWPYDCPHCWKEKEFNWPYAGLNPTSELCVNTYWQENSLNGTACLGFSTNERYEWKRFALHFSLKKFKKSSGVRTWSSLQGIHSPGSHKAPSVSPHRLDPPSLFAILLQGVFYPHHTCSEVIVRYSYGIHKN